MTTVDPTNFGIAKTFIQSVVESLPKKKKDPNRNRNRKRNANSSDMDSDFEIVRTRLEMLDISSSTMFGEGFAKIIYEDTIISDDTSTDIDIDDQIEDEIESSILASVMSMYTIGFDKLNLVLKSLNNELFDEDFRCNLMTISIRCACGGRVLIEKSEKAKAIWKEFGKKYPVLTYDGVNLSKRIIGLLGHVLIWKLNNLDTSLKFGELAGDNLIEYMLFPKNLIDINIKKQIYCDHIWDGTLTYKLSNSKKVSPKRYLILCEYRDQFEFDEEKCNEIARRFLSLE